MADKPQFNVVSDAALNRVWEISDQAEKWAGFAKVQLDALAEALTDELPQSVVGIDLSSVTSKLPTDWGTGFETQTPPEEPTADSLEGPETPTLPALPEIQEMTIAAPPRDTVDTSGAPGDAPTLTDIELPVLADLALPTGTITAPAIDVAQLTAEYSYSEPTYTAQVSPEVKAKLSSVLAGQLIVSTAIWDAQWDRAAGDSNRQQVAEEWQALNLGAALGWEEDDEATLARLDAAQEAGSKRLAATRLEKAIQEALQRREDLWQAVQHGIQFEGMWLQHHEALAQRTLASAAKAFEARVQVHEANLRRYNALLQRTAQQVAAGELNLKTAMAPLEVYRQRLLAAQTALDVDKERVQLWLGQWEGYKTKVTSATAVFSERVRAYTALVSAQREKFAADADYRRVVMEEGNQRVEVYKSLWAGIQTKTQAVAQLLNARTGVFQAKISEQEIRQRVQNMQMQTAIAEASLEKDVAVAQAQLSIQQIQWATEKLLGVLQALATTWAGLAQAGLAASDVSVGTSAGMSVSDTTSTSYNYQM